MNRALLGALCLVIAAEQSAETLDVRPLDPPDRLELRVASGGTGRDYWRARVGSTTTFTFCGSGELTVFSRAILGNSARGRYRLSIRLDGKSPRTDRRYHVDRDPDAVLRENDATALGSGRTRRHRREVGRGCHTAHVRLHSGPPLGVALRVSLQEREQVPRKWTNRDLDSAEDLLIIGARGRETRYHRVDGEYGHNGGRLDLNGPAEVRFLVRSLLAPGQPTSALEFSIKNHRGRVLRSYTIPTWKSKSSHLAEDRNLTPSRAREVSLRLPEGAHHLRLISDAGQHLIARAFVRAAPVSKPKSIETRVRLSSVYDSNILRYDDGFLELFESGGDPDRFRIESVDDIINRVELRGDRRVSGWKRRPLRLRLVFDHRAYLENSIKDRTEVALAALQRLSFGQSLELDFNFLPDDVYVREVRDSDLRQPGERSPFVSFEYSRWRLRLRYRRPIGSSAALTIASEIARYTYSENHIEFDSTNLGLNLRLDHYLTDRFRVTYGVQYTDSSARGYDQPGETKSTSDDTDPSYEDLDLELGLRFDLWARQRLLLQVERSERDYTTTKGEILAPVHFGRSDREDRYYASWSLEFDDKHRLSVFGQSRKRGSSRFLDRPDLGFERDYDAYEIGFRWATVFR